MREFHILNLGAGVQSTTLYLQNMDGDIGPRYDAAIFADTQEEPAGVYRHLEWLKKQGGPEIYVRTIGKMGEYLKEGENSTGQKFVVIPTFTTTNEGNLDNRSITRRQCTKEFKVNIVDRCIRREILGLKPRQKMRKDVLVHQHFGISRDEASRAHRIYQRLDASPWEEAHFPLLEMRWNRTKCQGYLEKRVPHKVVRSACHMCPYQSDAEWKNKKDTDPDGWKRAVEIDNSLRQGEGAFNRNLDQQMYVHKSCVPLDKLDLDKPKPQMAFDGFLGECDGLCGN